LIVYCESSKWERSFRCLCELSQRAQFGTRLTAVAKAGSEMSGLVEIVRLRQVS
jgi:hypothetical protein